MTPPITSLLASSVLAPSSYLSGLFKHAQVLPSFLFFETSIRNDLKSIQQALWDTWHRLIFYFLAEIGLQSDAEPLFLFFIAGNLLLEAIHLLQSSQNTVFMARILK